MNGIGTAVAPLVAGLALSLAAPVRAEAPLPTENAVRALLDRGEWYKATRQIDRLVNARLAARPALRPDPVLDRLIGEVFAAFSPSIARVLLGRAAADPTTADRTRYALLLASADETLGDVAAAEEIYRRLLAEEPRAAAGYRLAALGLARLLLVSRPRDALDVAAGLIAQPDEPAARWEAELIAARAARILGMRPEAAAYLELASQHAWSAPVADAAVARIALDRAAVAGMEGNRPALIAMAAVSRGGAQHPAGQQFMGLLPECGTNGIAPEDFVIIELVPRMGGRPRLGLLHASRPEIAAAFFGMVARTPLDEPSGLAMSVLLRCTTAPGSGAVQAWDDPIIEWAARSGAYPLIGDPDGEDDVRGQSRLAEQEARLGANSPFLVPVLTRLLSADGERVRDYAPGEVERLLGYARRLNTLLGANHAPPDARLPAALAETMLNAMSVQQSQQATVRAIRTTIEAGAADPALTAESLLAMSNSVPSDWPQGPELKAALLAQALERVRGASAAPADPRTRGLAVRLIALRRRLGDEAGAAALQRDYGIAGDLCAVAGTPPLYLSSEIGTEDYPTDAVLGNLRGRVGVDFALDARGMPQTIRVVMAEPPYVFDAATSARAPTIRYQPARIGAAARACRGATQVVNWQLP
jgi:hypothetical protein